MQQFVFRIFITKEGFDGLFKATAKRDLNVSPLCCLSCYEMSCNYLFKFLGADWMSLISHSYSTTRSAHSDGTNFHFLCFEFYGIHIIVTHVKVVELLFLFLTDNLFINSYLFFWTIRIFWLLEKLILEFSLLIISNITAKQTIIFSKICLAVFLIMMCVLGLRT